MSRTAQFILGILSVIIALTVGFYGRNQYLQAVSTYPVPVPIQTIPAYTLMRADFFEMREMPRTVEALPYFQSIQELDGKISTVPLPAGLPVASANAQPVSQFRLADAAFEVISIPVEPVSAVGGQIRIGERVNLYQVLPETSSSPKSNPAGSDQPSFQVEQIAGNVLVVDVRTSQGVSADINRQGKENATFSGSALTEQVQILTLAVKPESVSVILHALAISKKQGGLLWTTLALP